MSLVSKNERDQHLLSWAHVDCGLLYLLSFKSETPWTTTPNCVRLEGGWMLFGNFCYVWFAVSMCYIC